MGDDGMDFDDSNPKEDNVPPGLGEQNQKTKGTDKSSTNVANLNSVGGCTEPSPKQHVQPGVVFSPAVSQMCNISRQRILADTDTLFFSRIETDSTPPNIATHMSNVTNGVTDLMDHQVAITENDAHVENGTAGLADHGVMTPTAEKALAAEAAISAHGAMRTDVENARGAAAVEADQPKHAPTVAMLEPLGDLLFDHDIITPATPKNDTLSVQDIVDFGGIEDPSVTGLRHSARVRSQPNADAPQMERAMALAQRRDEYSLAGCSPSYLLDSHLVLPPSCGATGPYGYWMYPAYGGRPSYLVPAWLATY